MGELFLGTILPGLMTDQIELSRELKRLEQLSAQAQAALSADPKRALALAQEACNLAEQLGEREWLVRCALQVGDAYRALGEARLALELYREALGQTERASALQADVLHAAAVAYDSQGAYELALGQMIEVLKIRQGLGDKTGEARALNSIGVIFARSGDHEQSLYYYERALALQIELGDTLNRAIALNNVGIARKNLARYEAACEAYYEALALFEGLNHTLGQGAATCNLAVAYGKQGRHGEAEQLFARSLALVQATGNRTFEAEGRLDVGDFYLRLKRPEEALPHLARALTLGQEMAAKPAQYRAQQALAQAYELRGEFEAAYRHLLEYHRLEREVFSERSEQRLQALKVNFQLEQAERDKEIYRLRNVELKQALETLERQARLLEEQATRDPLTGLYNRRYLDGVLSEEFARTMRYQHPLSLAIADIDFFKRINDRLSHAVGDEVLRALAGLFVENTRTVDVVARYGGEEFVVMFRNTELEQAALAAEKIRQAIELHPWQGIHPELTVTVSMGLASSNGFAHYEQLLNAADINLYQAKHQGKNRVRL